MTVIPLCSYMGRGVELIGLGPTGMIFGITPTLQFILGYFYYNEKFFFSEICELYYYLDCGSHIL